MPEHVAVYISNNDDKHRLIETVISGKLISDFSNLKGALFSEITLNRYIDEEIRHGQFNVTTERKNNLQHSSEGEQKKALLQHVISQNPDFLVIDNVFGNLDISAQAAIENKLNDLSKSISIVQITNRKRDILPFINTLFQLKNHELVKINNTNEIGEIHQNIFLKALPKPDSTFKDPSNPLVKFDKVSVSYRDKPILKAISWEIKLGEFWQLIGPNGSGKSTILSMIFGDNPKAYGQNITLFGLKKGSGESIWEIKQKIGYFSSEMLRGFKRNDAIGNMIVSGFFDTIGLYKTPTSAQIKMAQHWLHVLNMFDLRKQSFLSLSRGHQRLVLIARAMVKNPPLLILDEPTNGLDDCDVRLFCALINKIASETSTAILYVSHRKEEGLNPDFIYELLPSKIGSVGKQVKF